MPSSVLSNIPVDLSRKVLSRRRKITGPFSKIIPAYLFLREMQLPCMVLRSKHTGQAEAIKRGFQFEVPVF